LGAPALEGPLTLALSQEERGPEGSTADEGGLHRKDHPSP
jgi:hypothetical protein